jgi:hypothetical protein
MENTGYGSIIGSSQAPYINSLAKQNGLATNYFALDHPSLPNYLGLTAGQTFSNQSCVINDADPVGCTQNTTNIADRIEASGRTWKAYMESMPSACLLNNSGTYAVRHNPFVYFTDIQTNTARCTSHNVAYSNLGTDLGSVNTTPNFVWVTPNTCDDMHDCSISTGDTWLSQNLPTIFNSPAWTFQKSLLVLTWDEDNSDQNNHIVTVVVGSPGTGVQHNFQSSVSYNHYSWLKTIETIWNLAPLTSNDGNATPMRDFFTSTTATPTSVSTQTPTPTTQSTSTIQATQTATPATATMPVGDIRGPNGYYWHQVWADDFNTNAPLGQFTSVYSNYDEYGPCWSDTSGNGWYYPDKVLSVLNGYLNYYIHSESGQCGSTGSKGMVAAPLLCWASSTTCPGSPKLAVQVGGKYSARFRADSLAQYKTAWLLWPDDDVWSEGEIDFPEGTLDGTISAFMHYKGSPSQQDAFDSTATYNQWHTASTEWFVNGTNDSVTFILDGQVIGVSTTHIPNTPMHWVLQSETDLGGIAPGPATAGNIQIDWIAQYSLNTGPISTPTPTLATTPLATSTATPTSSTATVIPTSTPIAGAITFHSSTTASNDSGSTSVILSEPPTVALNDVMLAQLTVATASTTITPPSGWVLVQRTQSSNSIAMVTFYKIVTASEPATYVFSFSGTTSATAGIVDYSGVNTASPIDTSSGLYNDTTQAVSFTEVVTTLSNDLLVAIVGVSGNTTVNASAGFTERYDANNTAASSGKTSELSDMVQAAVGTTNVGTGSEATFVGSNVAQLVALRHS